MKAGYATTARFGGRSGGEEVGINNISPLLVELTDKSGTATKLESINSNVGAGKIKNVRAACCFYHHYEGHQHNDHYDHHHHCYHH